MSANPVVRLAQSFMQRASRLWLKLALLAAGAIALGWFLVRVIPKPSRASYPCQRAAFPLASGFVLWLSASMAGLFALSRLRRGLPRLRFVTAALSFAAIAVWSVSTVALPGTAAEPSSAAAPAAKPVPPAPKWDWQPDAINAPIGVARGIFPGRVVWTRDAAATKWAGNWKQNFDQWWTDENTDQARVDAMVSATLHHLTGASTDEEAWEAIFKYYNLKSRGMDRRGYQPGEVVAVKINLNNCEGPNKVDNKIDASPHMVLAMVRQLVNRAHVAPRDIVVYDAKRWAFPAMLTKVWSEFKDVRFVQEKTPNGSQPKNPGYGDFHGLESADWVEGVAYSADSFKDAKLIPKQIFDATYLVNFALLKAHSFPYNTMENGDNGQTAVTMTGKNHFGSIKGTPELHADINTTQKGTPHAYSPMVDLAASPNLGGKTILFMLDGLYVGRKWRSYPQHFPNPPFNNRVEPYENPDWPACLLASLDGVAIDSVGLDILYSQTKNNTDPVNNEPRILIRENADDYLHEMADPQHAPSKTAYMQNGKPIASLGVHEHWDSDATRNYSRNLDPVNGKGIELVYLPLGGSKDSPVPDPMAKKPAAVTVAHEPYSPEVLPGRGLAQHDFLYAGEWDTRKPAEQSMFIVRGGKIVWHYFIPIKSRSGGIQEFDDVSLLPNGNVIFSRMGGAGIVSPEKKLVWNYDAPPGTEVHSAQYLGKDRVLIMRNGTPAQAMIFNIATNTVEKEIPIPTTVKGTHGQFRHIRMTPAGTILVPHMSEGKVVEYSLDGKEVWSVQAASAWAAVRLKNGNTLISGDAKSYVREVNPKGETVWEFTQADAPGIKLFNIQGANRLANGNTLICNWCANGAKNLAEWPTTVQVLEVTPDKKIVWALRSWTPPTDLGTATSIQLLDEPGTPDRPGDQYR